MIQSVIGLDYTSIPNIEGKRNMKITEQHKLMFQSYLRSCLASVLAVVATGNYALDDLVKALLAAALPPLLRWANPNDQAFGRTK